MSFREVSIFIFLFSFLSYGASKSKVNVSVEKASDLNNSVINVVPYFLPKTVFKIEVEVEKQIRKVGPFYRYSEKFLNLSDVITSDEEKYNIKSVKLLSIGKKDVDLAYIIRQEGKGCAQNILVNNEGVLCGINVKCNSGAARLDDTKVLLNEISISDINFDDVPYLEKQLLKTSTAAMAEEVANYIYKIRKRKMKIFTSDFENLPPDGKAYEKVDQELDELEKQFVELFKGKEVVQTIRFEFEFEPGLQGADRNVLFRFSEKGGILDRMDLSGAPIYIEITNLEQRQLPEGEVEKPQKIGPRGLYCINPGKSLVKIIDRNITLLEKEVPVAQFGQVYSLPVNMMQEEGSSIELSPVTGAVISISTQP